MTGIPAAHGLSMNRRPAVAPGSLGSAAFRSRAEPVKEDDRPAEEDDREEEDPQEVGLEPPADALRVPREAGQHLGAGLQAADREIPDRLFGRRGEAPPGLDEAQLRVGRQRGDAPSRLGELVDEQQDPGLLPGELRREVVELGAADTCAEAESGRYADLPRQQGERLEGRLQLLDLARVLFDPAEPGLDGGPGVLHGTGRGCEAPRDLGELVDGKPVDALAKPLDSPQRRVEHFGCPLFGVIHENRLPDLLAQGLEARDRRGHLSEGRGAGDRRDGRVRDRAEGFPGCRKERSRRLPFLRGAGSERKPPGRQPRTRPGNGILDATSLSRTSSLDAGVPGL